MQKPVNIFWFRRDLRLNDNTGLYAALQTDHPVQAVFIFDRNILDKLENKNDQRVAFIHAALTEIQEELLKLGGTLHVYYDTAENAWTKIVSDYNIEKVFTNNDYEPYAAERDKRVEGFLNQGKIDFQTYKDQVIFEKNEVTKDDGKPYTVFTPYSKKWKATLAQYPFTSVSTKKYLSNFYKQPPRKIPSLSAIGFTNTERSFPSSQLNEEIVKKYSSQRNYPGIRGTTKMGIHLRFGTISIRELAKKAMALNETFLNELSR